MSVHAVLIKKVKFKKGKTRHCVLAIVDKKDLPAKMRNKVKTPTQMHGCYRSAADASAKKATLEKKIKKPGGKARVATSYKKRSSRR